MYRNYSRNTDIKNDFGLPSSPEKESDEEEVEVIRLRCKWHLKSCVVKLHNAEMLISFNYTGVHIKGSSFIIEYIIESISLFKTTLGAVMSIKGTLEVLLCHRWIICNWQLHITSLTINVSNISFKGAFWF